MATSTTNLLGVVNAVLLNLNERPLQNTTSLMGQKVKGCIETALTDISEAQDWRFSESLIASVSWVSNTVTLPANVQKVEEVYFQSGNFGSLPLIYVGRDDFERYPVSGYTAGRALYWTDIDYNVVKVAPYPNNPTEQAKILFRVLNRLTMPPTDTSTFDMPEQFVLLLIRRATELMARRHTEDLSLAQAYQVEYLESLTQLRQKNSGRNVKFQNAYRDK